jgi:hypothetical protein
MISVAAPPRFIGAFAAEAHSVMAEVSILKLRTDLASVFALVRVAKAVRSGEPEPQVSRNSFDT